MEEDDIGKVLGEGRQHQGYHAVARVDTVAAIGMGYELPFNLGTDFKGRTFEFLAHGGADVCAFE